MALDSRDLKAFSSQAILNVHMYMHYRATKGLCRLLQSCEKMHISE